MDKIPDNLIDKDADQYATTFIKRLLANDTAYCISQLDPDIRNEKAEETIAIIARMMPGRTEKSHRITNINVTKGITTKRKIALYQIEYEYTFSDTYGYYAILLNKTDDKFSVKGFNANYKDAPLGEVYKFSLVNKSFLQYLFLLLGAAIIIFKIITIVAAAKTPIPKKGWWIFFIIIGIGRLSINWYNGDINFMLLQVDVIGAGINKSGLVAPWMVNIFVPLGAILFWIRRRNFIRHSKIENDIKDAYHNMGNDAAYPDDQT